MNPIFDLLDQHRSIRKYKTNAVAPELVKSILHSGMRASTSGNMQFYSIIQSTHTELKEKLYHAHGKQSMVRMAPIVLTFCCDLRRLQIWMDAYKAPGNFNNFISFLRGVIDVSLVAQNIAIAAESSCLGICYMGSTLMNAKKITEILKLPQLVIPVTSMVMGYPEESPKKIERLAYESIVHEEVYRDRSPKEVQDIYADRDKNTWERVSTNPQHASKLVDENIQNAAQFYAKTKYTPELLQQYSNDYIECLKKQFHQAIF